MDNVFTQSRVIMPVGTLRPRVRAQAVGKKSVRVRARLVRKGVAIFSVAIALALIFVWTRVRVVQIGYEVSQLNRKVSELSRQKNQIEVEVAKLKSPDRLEKIAVERFAMRLPAASEIVFIKGSERVEQAQPNSQSSVNQASASQAGDPAPEVKSAEGTD